MDELRLTDPVQEILAVWRRWAEFAHAPADEGWGHSPGRKMRWGDLGNESNSIADAEMLQCVLLPQGRLPDPLALGNVNALTREAREALGTKKVQDMDAMRHLAQRLFDYFDVWGGDVPKFAPGSYVIEPAADVEFPPVLDAYTLSISLCIQTKLMLRSWKDTATASDLKIDQDQLDHWVDARLTAAMVGVCRSFAARTTAKLDWRTSSIVKFPVDEMASVRQRLQPYFLDHVASQEEFECGWSWGEVKLERGTKLRDTLEGVSHTWSPPTFYAEPAPYLYFTVMAIDAIAELFSPRVRAVGILNTEQSSLQSELGTMWEAVSEYWKVLAFSPSLPDRRLYAIEYVPWRTPDGSDNELWSLYLLRIITAGPEMTDRRTADERFERLTGVLEEIAQRIRLSRRSINVGLYDPNGEELQTIDPGKELHRPGAILINLRPRDRSAVAPGGWWVYDAAPQLIKIAGRLLRTSNSRTNRERLTDLIDAAWRHMCARRLRPWKRAALDSFGWDVEAAAWNEDAAPDDPLDAVRSWYITERMVEALVAVEEAKRVRLPADIGQRLAVELISEARHLVTTGSMTLAERSRAMQGIQDAERDLDDSWARGLSSALVLMQRLASPSDES